MPPSREPDAPRSPRLTLRRPDQFVAGVLLTIALVAIAIHWTYQAGLRRGLIEIDRAPPRSVQFQVDVNRADWPELALMPRIGEQLAKRIVQDRQVNGPFRDLNDLRRVRGIGPKTLEEMRPYLSPMPDSTATVAR